MRVIPLQSSQDAYIATGAGGVGSEATDPGSDKYWTFKYSGYCQTSDQIRTEYQIVSMLTGLFREVEPSTIYKPDPRLRGIAKSIEMRQRTTEVLNALTAFEAEFERLIA
jgi:hypothetical protein